MSTNIHKLPNGITVWSDVYDSRLSLTVQNEHRRIGKVVVQEVREINGELVPTWRATVYTSRGRIKLSECWSTLQAAINYIIDNERG